MTVPHRPTRELKTRNRRHLRDTNAAGLSSASLHGCNGNAAYSFAGNIAPQASSALCSSLRLSAKRYERLIHGDHEIEIEGTTPIWLICVMER